MSAQQGATQIHDTTSMSLPGPVYLPGASIRNPITGRGYVYSNYAWSKQRPKVSPHSIREHERSCFMNTNYNSSFYVIHPDWTSEAPTLKRVIAKERRQWAWDGRPAVQPLRETSRDTYLPMLNKLARTKHGADGPLYYKNMVNYLDNYQQGPDELQHFLRRQPVPIAQGQLENNPEGRLERLMTPAATARAGSQTAR